uniref:Uncharacterized protein n=1 Tax=Amphimedon queenslandica TaxID=400682 RepID=A0A1X7TEN6_AMPQE
MTSFQRMVLVAAVLFMITAHVTDAAKKEGTCYLRKGCVGTPYYMAENLKDISISSVHHKEIKKDTTTIKLKMTSFQRMVLVAAVVFMVTARVTEAQGGVADCFPQADCKGIPEASVDGDGQECCDKGHASYATYSSAGVPEACHNCGSN